MLVGVDFGNDTFHLVGFEREGQLISHKKIKRLALVATFEKLPRCVVGMEACLSAHFSIEHYTSLGLNRELFQRSM